MNRLLAPATAAPASAYPSAMGIGGGEGASRGHAAAGSCGSKRAIGGEGQGGSGRSSVATPQPELLGAPGNWETNSARMCNLLLPLEVCATCVLLLII